MPELRKDPIVDRWVIIAENRAERPQELSESEPPCVDASECPFCEGHEEQTTPEVAAYRAAGTAPNGPGWRVRAVPNKYPALEAIGAVEPHGQGLYQGLAGVGVHEVIIESPRHLRGTADLTVTELAEVLGMYRDRLLELAGDRRLVYPMIFKNVGAAAGASLAHTHSQLIATPIVPISVAEELAGAETHFRATGQCVYCALNAAELESGQRLIERPQSAASAGFVAYCPYAARFPYETWIVPARHAARYETLSPADCVELARVVRVVLAKIDAALDRPAYNYIIHTAPFDTNSFDHYHWHIEIIPRVTKTAGFEWGTGFYINPVSPEEAAMSMRALQIAG
jgi:UDPglucose--hexose-1-phosphate uridylyltransferase